MTSKLKHFCGFIICCTLIFSGCSRPKKPSPPLNGKSESAKTKAPAKPEPTPAKPKPEPKTGPTWSYVGLLGPQFWGDLDPTFSQCKKGKQQSPIDLKWSKPKPGGELKFSYKDTPLRVIDTGYTIKVNVDSGLAAILHEKSYRLTQVHFHTSSEHALSGNVLPMEAHFVHENQSGELAIVAAILVEGQANTTVAKIWAHIPPKKRLEGYAPGVTWNPFSLLPTTYTHYSYKGSLTTPPCTEGVQWYVLNTPIQISREQILAFRSIYPNNNRPIQRLNGRSVVNH